MSIAPGAATRLEKAAFDNGFDQDLGRDGGWLAFTSTHASLKVWLLAQEGGPMVAAFSRADVGLGLADLGTPGHPEMPPDAAASLVVETVPNLNRLLRRAYQLARTLPHQLLRDFEQKTAGMPRATEAERLVVQRVGQDVFRAGLMDYWDGKCAVTGLAVPELLRASHIKPWAECETDAERLDVFNGLLLAPHLDAAFDRGFITLSDAGELLISPVLSIGARRLLGLDEPLQVRGLAEGHGAYLPWHREKWFKRG